MNRATTHSRKHEGGYALIVVVLLAMIVLAGLVIVTANMSLSSRRSTTQQKAILPAQLAAESGVAYAKAKLKAAEQLIGQNAPPVGTTYGQIKTWISSLCPTATPVPVPGYNPATAPTTAVPNTPFSLPSSAVVCTINTFSPAQAAFFANLIAGQNGQVLDSDGGASTTDMSSATYATYGLPTDYASRANFYDQLFAADANRTFASAQVKSGLRPVALMQTNTYEYRLYFQVGGMSSTGSKNGSSRLVTVDGNNSYHVLRVQFSFPQGTDPNFSAFGLFVNDFGTNGYYGYQNDLTA